MRDGTCQNSSVDSTEDGFGNGGSVCASDDLPFHMCISAIGTDREEILNVRHLGTCHLRFTGKGELLVEVVLVWCRSDTTEVEIELLLKCQTEGRECSDGARHVINPCSGDEV